MGHINFNEVFNYRGCEVTLSKQVFSILYVKAESDEMARNGKDNATDVKYGQKAFVQIHRFVVAEVKRGFVYAW